MREPKSSKKMDFKGRGRQKSQRSPKAKGKKTAFPPPKKKPMGKKIQNDLYGTLELVHPTNLFQLMNNISATGLLEVATLEEIVSIYFKNGKIIFAEAESNKIKLGSLLVKKGLVNKEKAQEALDIFEDERGKRRIGEILVDLGYIDEDALEKAVTSQIKIAIANTLLWKEGEFQFFCDVEPPEDSLLIDLNIQYLILEVVRRTDESNGNE